MTPEDYAVKYGIGRSGLYKSLYSGRIVGTLRDGRWDVEDVPPPPPRAKKASSTLDGVTDYELSLIWLNGTISGDALLLRSKDAFVPQYFSQRLPGSIWYSEERERWVFKSGSVKLCRELRALGFTGRKDAALAPPPVNPMDFSAALVESRCSFTRCLNRSRKGSGYYVPAVRFCASYPIMERFVSTLAAAGVLPPRRLTAASNGTSATLTIRVKEQMEDMHCLLSPLGANQAFWDEFWTQAHRPHVPR